MTGGGQKDERALQLWACCSAPRGGYQGVECGSRVCNLFPIPWLWSRPALIWGSCGTLDQAAGKKKLWKGLLGAFSPGLHLSSVPCLSYTVCEPVRGCVPCWPLPWLPSLTLDLPHHCKLVWWVQDCGWPRLMPLDLLCLLRDCGTMLLACEVPGSWLASLGRGLAAPRYVCLAGLGFFFSSVENKLLSCCLSVHENGQVCLGRWTWGNMWRGIILKGY